MVAIVPERVARTVRDSYPSTFLSCPPVVLMNVHQCRPATRGEPGRRPHDPLTGAHRASTRQDFSSVKIVSFTLLADGVRPRPG
jgi:hypothetical protein